MHDFGEAYSAAVPPAMLVAPAWSPSKTTAKPSWTVAQRREATRTLVRIQSADRVVILNSHVKLIGQPDVANIDQTAQYSLNRIGDHDKAAMWRSSETASSSKTQHAHSRIARHGVGRAPQLG